MSVQLKIDMKNTTGPWIRSIIQQLNNIPREAYQEFVKITPIDTGNAKRSTSRKGDTIHANYAYAQVLDKGRHMTNSGMRGSKQAPRGMTKPTQEFVARRVKAIIGR